jgi:hypothetical protein
MVTWSPYGQLKVEIWILLRLSLLSKTPHKLALGFRGKHDRILVIIRLISLLHQPTTINNRSDEVYRKSCPSPLPQLSFKTHSPKLV